MTGGHWRKRGTSRPMAITCPACGRQYDVTLFEFKRRIRCECGARLDLASGHATGGTPPDAAPSAITPATWEYIRRPDIAEDYDRYFCGNELFHFDTEALDRWMPSPGRLLDLGCGTGRHLVHFAKRGFEVTGIDLSEHMLAVACRKLAEAGCGATLLSGDISRLDEMDLGHFDYVICMFSTLGMVYGAENRLRMLRAVRNVLEPHGLFCFHVHNRWHNLWDREGRRYLRRALWRWLLRRPEAFQKLVDGYRGITGMSLYVFSAREIKRVARDAGFSIRELVYLNHARNAPLRGPVRGVRANGFLVLCAPAGARAEFPSGA